MSGKQSAYVDLRARERERANNNNEEEDERWIFFPLVCACVYVLLPALGQKGAPESARARKKSDARQTNGGEREREGARAHLPSFIESARVFIPPPLLCLHSVPQINKYRRI